MKITTKQLKRIIKEEKAKLLKEMRYDLPNDLDAVAELSQGLNDAELNLSALIDDVETEPILSRTTLTDLDNLITELQRIQKIIDAEMTMRLQHR